MIASEAGVYLVKCGRKSETNKEKKEMEKENTKSNLGF